MIDLCPVGALTSKPFRYAARSWELSRRKSVAPHDGLGSNLVIQVKQNTVMRLLPLENEAINECWLSDRDRFSYEALNSAERLTKPMIRSNGLWSEATWPEALQAVADGLARVRDMHGGEQLAALASPTATLEELYLLNKLMRGLGSANIETRLRQRDSQADGKHGSAHWLGMPVSEIAQVQRVLLVGSTLRKEQPLLATRFRAAANHGQRINVVHVSDDDLLMPVANKFIVHPNELPVALAAIAKALAELKGASLPGEVANAVANVTVTEAARAIAHSLNDDAKVAVFLGHYAQQHPRYTALHGLAQEIARLAGGTLGIFAPAGNSVGAAVIGAQGTAPQPRRGYVLLNVEPEADCAAPDQTLRALQQAPFVVALSMFKSDAALDYAQVLLPIAPFTETAGTFVNMEGRVQSFNGVVKPLGETRPAWKVLRVLGNLLGLSGFDQDSVEDIRAEIAPDLSAFVGAKLNNMVSGVKVDLSPDPNHPNGFEPVSIYAVDSMVRRAPSLQLTADAKRARR